MGILKLPKYLELPGGIQPVTRCKRDDISPFIILTNTPEMAEKGSKYLEKVYKRIKGDEAAFTITGAYKNIPITIASGGVGANQNSNIIEELINIGGKIFIQLGATGAIQENINLGDLVIPVGSVRDEGLSSYYAPLGYPALSDYRIVSSLVETAKIKGYTVHTGIIRTTEGMYPSQRIEEYVKRYHDLGVLSVEQEVSGILTVCSTRRCYAGACLCVIGNLVTGLHYWQGDKFDFLEKKWLEQIEVILDAIVKLKEKDFSNIIKRE